MNDASDNVLERNRVVDPSTRIDGFQRVSIELRDLFAKPPRHAIHRRQHDGACADHGAERRCKTRQRLSFNRNDQHILLAEGDRIGVGADCAGTHLAT